MTQPIKVRHYRLAATKASYTGYPAWSALADVLLSVLGAALLAGLWGLLREVL